MLTFLRQWRAARRLQDQLRKAVQQGEVATVEQALREGADPNLEAPWGANGTRRAPSLLLWAASDGSLDVARVLIEHGAHVHEKDHPWGRRAAHYLAFRAEEPGAMDILVTLLLRHPKAFDAKARLGLGRHPKGNHTNTPWQNMSPVACDELRARVEEHVLRNVLPEGSTMSTPPRARI